jgi:hypothetical protein
MHVDGQGMLRSLFLAHTVLGTCLASATGNEIAATHRDGTENRMTQDQIAEAQALARVCMSSGYQDCE